MERLYEIHQSGRYDLIIVDTPPTRNAIDFLEAPERMADFFSSKLLRWLTAPYRSRLLNAASKPFYSMADRILGSQFLEDIADFFILFQTMYDGFVERARFIERTLADRCTTFVVVSTLDTAPATEAEFFIEALAERELHLGALVLNKVLPSFLVDNEAGAMAVQVCRDSASLAARLVDEGVDGITDADQVERVLTEVAESFVNYRVVASREADEAARLGTRPGLVAKVAYLESDVHDLGGLLELGERLWR